MTLVTWEYSLILEIHLKLFPKQNYGLIKKKFLILKMFKELKEWRRGGGGGGGGGGRIKCN